MKKVRKILMILFLPGLYLIVNTCSETSADSNELFSNYQPHEWETTSPGEVGINPGKIELAIGEAHLKKYMHSLLIIKENKLVVEEYFNGYEKEDPHIVRSVSKSILSILVGFAIEDGFISSLDNTLYQYIPDLLTPGTNENMKNITIRNLLEMKAGIKKDTDFYSEAFNSDNWIQTILEEDLVSNPGERFVYSTAATHLLAVVLERSIDKELLQYAYDKLFDPLEIEIADWEKDPQGHYFGGNNMHFVPRDLALIGQVVLNGGSLSERQIIPQQWLEVSLTDNRNKEGITWGKLNNIGYGYLWWLGDLGDYKAWLAIGHGGQYIIILPEVNMIIVTTSEAYVYWDEADEQERGVISLVTDYILPAINNN